MSLSKNNTYILYGWHLSYFSGKTRCYLAHKQLSFIDQAVSLFTLTHTIKRKTGAVVMPVLRTQSGEWLQDTSDIFDILEERHPDNSMVPSTPVARCISYLIEAWADEWWVPIAMHTRWSYPENYALFEQEAGSALLPIAPRWIQKRLAAYIASTLRGYLHGVGVRPTQNAIWEQWTHHMLNMLEAHFAQHNYLLGSKPCLADFSLAGPLYAHLGRDPWPAREMISIRPHVRAWIDRMADPDLDTTIDIDKHYLPDEQIVSSLAPILTCIFKEFSTMVAATNEQVQHLGTQFPAGKPLPRGLSDINLHTEFGTIQRHALPYTLWMAQRAHNVYKKLSPEQQSQVNATLNNLGAATFYEIKLPRVARKGLRVSFADNI